MNARFNDNPELGVAATAGRIRTVRRSLVAAMVMLFAAGMVTAQQAPEEPFLPAPPPDDDVVRELLEPEVVRLGFVFVEPDFIGGPEQIAGAGALTLNLFEDVQLTALKDRLERRSIDDYTWFGRLSDDLTSSVILVVRGRAMAGTILSGDRIYRVLALNNDTRHAVREIDQSLFVNEEPPEEPPVPIPATGQAVPAVPGDPELGRVRPAGLEVERGERRLPRRIAMRMAEQPLNAACGDEDYIDVLVVYTQDAADAHGDIHAEIQAAIDDTNESYIASGIVQRLRLVHAEMVDYEESGDAILDRDRLRDPGDGFMDGVHALRDTYGADIVSLWTRESDWCGYAFIMGTVSPTFEDRAFNVVKLSCAVSNHTFAHELGHNMSARHDRYVDNTDGSPFDFNHGYVKKDASWRTIMAYNDECKDDGGSCTRLQFWSNPDIDFGGDPMGIPDGEADAADNRLTLNSTRTTVQAFRDTHAPLADAGPDIVGECGQPTMLDGSGSCDPDGDLLDYTWTGGFEEGGGTAFGVMPVVTFPKGIHPVTLVVSDGLISSVPDTVIVDTTADLTPPQISCPADVTVSCDQPTDPSNTGSAFADDLCDPDPVVSFLDFETPGACPQEKTIERQWTATDDDGNASGCTQIVTVEDTAGPEVTCGVAISELWPANHQFVDVGFTFSAVDDCDPEPAIAITVTSDEHAAAAPGAGGPQHCPDAVVGEDGSVLLRAERSGAGDGRVYVITVTATDACGNANACAVQVAVPKSQGQGGAAVDSGQLFDATVCAP
jgi:peptidyl-Asp metalloendopeptidase